MRFVDNELVVGVAFKQLCYDTCYSMYNACIKSDGCVPGTNTTLKDEKGNLILDDKGQPKTVSCQQNKTTADKALDAANSAGNSIAGAGAAVSLHSDINQP